MTSGKLPSPRQAPMANITTAEHGEARPLLAAPFWSRSYGFRRGELEGDKTKSAETIQARLGCRGAVVRFDANLVVWSRPA